MNETEITVQVFEDYASIYNKLVSQGFDLIEDYYMYDYYK